MAYRIAHSGITWGYDASTAAAAVRDVARVGYNAYETIGGVIEAYEAAGASYADLLARHRIGLIGTYVGTRFRHGEDPAQDIANARRWIMRAKELGATTVLLAAGSRRQVLAKTGRDGGTLRTPSPRWRASPGQRIC